MNLRGPDGDPSIEAMTARAPAVWMLRARAGYVAQLGWHEIGSVVERRFGLGVACLGQPKQATPRLRVVSGKGDLSH